MSQMTRCLSTLFFINIDKSFNPILGLGEILGAFMILLLVKTLLHVPQLRFSSLKIKNRVGRFYSQARHNFWLF